LDESKAALVQRLTALCERVHLGQFTGVPQLGEHAFQKVAGIYGHGESS
jgi:hypothetical protein